MCQIDSFIMVNIFLSYAKSNGDNTLTHCILFFFHAILSSADFFLKINVLKNFFQEYHQNVKQFGPLSGLIWVQTVCKGYQQTALVDKELIKHTFSFLIDKYCNIVRSNLQTLQSFISTSHLKRKVFKKIRSFANVPCP